MSIGDVRQSDAEHMEATEIDQFLRDQGVGVLALPASDVPYVIPLSFGYDGNSCLYFTYLLFSVESKKEDLTERTDQARFLVYAAESMYEWRSVILTGTIRRVPEREWDDLQAAMQNAWHPDLFAGATPMRGITGYRFTITDRSSIKHSTADEPTL
jgi:nitroimidazol reductase NimA-like FMN-containing flavoprotein (pyridoxamine 5'-phosphate oxidase superfamily)